MLVHEYTYVNKVRLHYVRNGTGKLMLFLHGFPEFWYEWRQQLEEFGRDHLAVAVDMRGYNLSAKPEGVENYRMRPVAEDIRQLAERLGQKRFILVAHDWGGSVAYAFSLFFPEYLEKLIIINAFHPAIFYRELRENPAQRKASQYILLFRRPEAEKLLAADSYAYLRNEMLREAMAGGYLNEDDVDAYIRAWSRPGALTGGLSYYRAMRADALEDPDSPAARAPVNDSRMIVRVPTLVIWGEKDRHIVVHNLDGLEKYIPDLRVRRVPDASHWVVHEKPGLVNRYIREFLDEG